MFSNIMAMNHVMISSKATRMDCELSFFNDRKLKKLHQNIVQASVPNTMIYGSRLVL